MTACATCGAARTTRDPFCPVCGGWDGPENTVCGCPREETAIGCCVVCGLPVCVACGITDNGALVCSDPVHREMQRTHRMLDGVRQEFEADWVAVNLHQRGIKAVVMDLRSLPALFGFDLETEARVFVPVETVDEAENMLESFDTVKGKRNG